MLPQVAYSAALIAATAMTPVDHSSGPLPPAVKAWLSSVDAAIVAEIESHYAAPTPDAATVARLAEAFAQIDPQLGELLTVATLPSTNAAPSSPPEWLLSDRYPPEVVAAVSLVVARTLHARRQYEECVAWLAPLHAKQTVAPHLLHYYRATANHGLVQLELARTQAEALLALDHRGGRRHVYAAELILHDIKETTPEGLDFVARAMNDVRRRLDLGRPEEPNQELQQRVIDELDKLIEEAEQQQQQQQAQQAAGGQPQQGAAKPMDDSKPGDLKGAGDVDEKQIVAGDDWGSLPPAERERVKQQLGRDFPSYYRELIEAYFRTLADDDATEQSEPPTEEDR